jgi:hypothetical protein
MRIYIGWQSTAAAEGASRHVPIAPFPASAMAAPQVDAAMASQPCRAIFKEIP